MATIPTCCVTGRIAGDPYACGDCDPCILGAQHVPEVVKKVIAERDEWADKYAGAMMELDELKGAVVNVGDDLHDVLADAPSEGAPKP